MQEAELELPNEFLTNHASVRLSDAPLRPNGEGRAQRWRKSPPSACIPSFFSLGRMTTRQ